MAEQGAVTRTLLGVQRGRTDDRGVARRLCQACVDSLEVDGAALSLLTSRDSRETLWATDAVAELMEDLQFTLNEGPCMEAARSGRPVLVPDLYQGTESVRWPIFAAELSEQTDVRTLLALPLQWGTVNLGVLDLYRNAPGGLADEQWRDVLAATDTAAWMMLGLRTDPGDGDDTGGWLDHAQGHRAEVHQATGMVLAQLDITAADALARMRGYAFVRQRLLIDVARDVVARRLVFTPDMS